MRAFAIVDMNKNGGYIVLANIKIKSSETAEEAAIALTLSHTQGSSYLSDSKMAMTDFAKERITSMSLRLLNGTQFSNNSSELIWVPVQSPNPANDEAHAKARVFVERAVDGSASLKTTKSTKITYHELTIHFEVERTSPCA